MNEDGQQPPRAARFATTVWENVRQAATSLPAAAPARQALCEAYWFPVFSFLRRLGQPPDDAEDTSQSFFSWLIEENILERADARRGRFRTFLIACLRQFVARQHEHCSAAKRKPVEGIVSMHGAGGELRYQDQMAHDLTPERLFERTWAIDMLRRVMQRMGDEWRAADRGARFDALHVHLTDGRDLSGRDLARQLQMSEGAVRVAIHRLKQRYGELLRAEVAATLSPEESVDDELRQLMASLSE